MNTPQEVLSDTWLIDIPAFTDLRGRFVKTYATTFLDQYLHGEEVKEQYYSSSKADTVRGMHYQSPPYEHFKIVHCLAGKVIDVLLDLRRGPNYGQYFSLTLDEGKSQAVVIPPGIAHGFRALTNGAVMLYATTAEHVPDADSGVLWSSFGADWECQDAIVSDRDRKHPVFKDLQSPF